MLVEVYPKNKKKKMGAIDPDFVVIATGGALISAVVIVHADDYCLHHVLFPF